MKKINWFGKYYNQLEIATSYNLTLIAANMVQNEVGIALCFRMDNCVADVDQLE